MCLFCDIVEGKIPSTKVYENDYVLCFNDINPVAPVHVLVVPKKHFANMNELASDPEGALYSAEITKAVAEVAKIKGIEDAYRTINNCGEGAGQTVMHVHFHVIGGVELTERLI
ncbi:MAG: histidine triad nucleotide-binding protein [Clostridiales bacterium]|nr:histidine triad nucleotide-binding protein [Clostridiales bacterium]